MKIDIYIIRRDKEKKPKMIATETTEDTEGKYLPGALRVLGGKKKKMKKENYNSHHAHHITGESAAV